MKITAEKFRQATGRESQGDDLERCNCKLTGEPGHIQCGWCKHNKPIFECEPCTLERVRKM